MLATFAEFENGLKDAGARPVDIARQLKIGRASVCRALGGAAGR
jgi:hypothetical protein